MALSDLGSLAVVLVVVTIALSMGALVLSEVRSSETVNKSTDAWARNATDKGLSSVATASGFLPVVAIVVVAAIIIGIVATSFRGSGGGM